jgi:SPX domain protein involved in polyphosphate accumulation
MGSRLHFNTNRFELKYLIDERQACGIRDFVRTFMRRDPFAQPDMRWSYANYSIYLDGADLPLYSATIQGQRNRFKLRLRYYDDRSETPVFFEVKRRVNDSIRKERAAVRKEVALRLLRGGWPLTEDLCNPSDNEDLSSLRRFCELRDAVGAEPRIVTYFEREAWVDPQDKHRRVTFDRASQAAPFRGSLCMRDSTATTFPAVILELKFTDRFPIWMREMVQAFDLHRTSMAKYVHCTNRMNRKFNGFSQFLPMCQVGERIA